MPKKNRNVPPNSVLHIVNRGNDKKVIFPEPVDYAAFLVLLREAREKFGVDLYAYCLMPNHFHLVVRTLGLEQISAYMHFVQREHACDLRRCWRSKGHGHVFQRRYWSKVVEGDGYLMTVMRYVEANPYRAGLIDASQSWEWSSLWDHETGERDLLQPSHLWLPDDWRTIVTVPLQQADLERIRKPAKIGRPRRPKLRAA
jgi:putative transposase